MQSHNIWMRYLDDTFMIQQSQKEEFLHHINPVESSILFLDTLITSETDKFLSVGVCIKPTHTDLCFQWDSHHNLTAK